MPTEGASERTTATDRVSQSVILDSEDLENGASVVFSKTSIPLFWRRKEGRRRGEERRLRLHRIAAAAGRSDFTSTSGISFPAAVALFSSRGRAASASMRACTACLSASLPLSDAARLLIYLHQIDLSSAPTNERTNELSHSHRTSR